MEISKITLKRINGDFKLFEKTNPLYFDVFPNKDNILEIYFLLYGRPNTPFENGQYIGKIIHNKDYPTKAPDYIMLTPNGRFSINKKICLTNSGFHQADWAPAAWNLVSILEGLSSVWHSDIKEDKVGISHENHSPEQIKVLAGKSIDYNNQYLPELYNNFTKVKNNYNPYEKKDT